MPTKYTDGGYVLVRAHAHPTNATGMHVCVYMCIIWFNKLGEVPASRMGIGDGGGGLCGTLGGHWKGKHTHTFKKRVWMVGAFQHGASET